jgi:bacillithiol system protein YtxJ
MNWIALEREEQLEQIIADSRQHPVVIFKHSTRCSISTMAKGRLDRSAEPQGMLFYYLDLIRYRSLSNQVAEVFHVHHESPQILLIKDGNCTYEESHNGIDMEELLAQV